MLPALLPVLPTRHYPTVYGHNLRTAQSSCSPPFLRLSYPSIGVFAGVSALPLFFGQGGDEFAAEIGDVGDHTAPDRVNTGCG